MVDGKLGREMSAAHASDDAAAASSSSTSSSVSVIIGTSALASGAFARRVSEMVNCAYGHSRLSPSEVLQRLAMGDDAEERTNRVLHLAYRNDELVGCCSSTRQPPWTPSGCGHWGLLVVDVNAQGTGVASALVRTAEARLASLGCRQVQIEYSYTCGDAESERLRAWYEGPLNFSGGGSPTTVPGRSEFRRLRKALAKASTEKRANGASDDQAETAVGFSGCFGLLRRLLRRFGVLSVSRVT